ncbi:MAG: excinuclease ABC subunit UvrB, partial [Armatimonadetes bacterium]|nr:excinuclease ABC subunit UvrB [Armatimonadota bacterium]
IATTDTYIEKDADINDEIDRLRHASTQALLRRRDVIVVASVSCIYGLGSPEDYKETILMLEKGGTLEREQLLRKLVQMQFERNDVALSRGKFRARGDVLEVWPADEEILVRVSLSYDEIARIALVHPVTSEVLALPDDYVIYPAKHFITPEDKMEEALRRIEEELDSRLQEFRSQGKLLEAQRLENKTRYDLEMLREIGYCSGIENYSRHLSLRNEGDPPATLLDYFPDDFLTVMDESHVTIPQLAGMYYGDRSRKDSLVTHGFRLPSAYDNRPLVFEEFYGRIGQVIFVSATPGPWEYEKSAKVVEQIIRPTGLVDPDVSVRPSKNQIDDLISEIREREKAKERVLVTTLTKRMAEDLTDYLLRAGIRVRYLHSEVDTLDRIQILRDLRLGAFDVLVGINLLREGLDLPEVSLVAILDADKEGFLRSETTLIQTMGRAARNVRGQVIMYADSLTNSMKRALNETKRRRDIQKEFNQAHNITPESVTKAVRDILEAVEAREDRGSYKVQGREKLSDEALSDLLKALDQAMRKPPPSVTRCGRSRKR